MRSEANQSVVVLMASISLVASANLMVAPGYVVAAEESKSEAESLAAFFMTVERSAFGAVVDESGSPIAGVKIQAATPRVGFHSSFSMPTGGDDIVGKSTLTDADGSFRIDGIKQVVMKSEANSRGSIMLRLRSPYRWTNDANYKLEEDLRIVLRGSGKQGIIRLRLIDDESGKPVTEFMVCRRHDPTMKLTASSDGRYELSGRFTRHKQYQMLCYAPGYEAQSVRATAFDPESDERTEVRLKRRPSLVVQLVDERTGRPVKNARIMAARLGTEKSPAWYIEWNDFDEYVDGHHSFQFVQRKDTDRNGMVSFSRIPDGELALLILTNGYQREVFLPSDINDLPSDNGAKQISLKAGSSIVGRVTENGKPLADASVSVGTSAKLGGLEQMMSCKTKTDAHGMYRLENLRPGRYGMTVEGHHYSISLGTKALQRDVVIDGAIVFGKSFSNGSVTATPEFETTYSSISAATDEHGQFQMRGLAAGIHRLQAYSFSGGFRQRYSVVVDVEEGQVTEVNVLDPDSLFARPVSR